MSTLLSTFLESSFSGSQGVLGGQGTQGRQGLIGLQGTQGIQGISFNKTSNTFTATQGQTTFNVTYVVGYADVYLNGARLSSSDYVATNGTSIVLSSGADAGDIIDVISFTAAGPQGIQGIPGPAGTQGLNGAFAGQGIQGTAGVSFNKSATTYTATQGQTTFSATYTVGFVEIYLNGVRLSDTEYTASNGTSIVLSSGASVGDIIDIIAFTGGVLGTQGIQGTSGSSSVTVSNDTSTNATRYILFDDITSGTVSTVNVSSSKLTFNPSTGQLTSVDFNSTSDQNLKENIVSLSDSIDILNKINPVKFNWKDNGKVSYGVIAQELEKILPELVSDVGEYKSVSYVQLIAFLIDVVKKHEEEINLLKNSINS
jgi:hypothetical protein